MSPSSPGAGAGGFDLRPLGDADVDSYRTLRLRALREEPRAFSDDFDDERGADRAYFRAAMGDAPTHVTVGAFDARATLVGTATFRRDPRRKARHKATVHTMYVAPEARRAGLGTRLLAVVIGHGRALGVAQLHLWVLDPASSAARRLYLRVGFAPQGTVVRDDLLVAGRYVDAEYLTLALGAARSTDRALDVGALDRAVADHGP